MSRPGRSACRGRAAYRLRRSAHGAAFARAWDAARHHAGGLIEDIAFERAIEGTEQEVLNSEGEVIATRLVHDNRLLKYLLSHLKPERYGSARVARRRIPGDGHAGSGRKPPRDGARSARAARSSCSIPRPLRTNWNSPISPTAYCRTSSANSARPKSDAELAAEQAAARDARGAAALKKSDEGGELTDEEFADLCYHLDPVSNARPRSRRRQGT